MSKGGGGSRGDTTAEKITFAITKFPSLNTVEPGLRHVLYAQRYTAKKYTQ